MKKQLGISIYPEQSTFEKDKAYLDFAKSLGYTQVFTSYFHVNNQPIEVIDKINKSLKYAKSIGFYTIADFENVSLQRLGIDLNDPKKCLEMGIDCIRLDSPSLPSEIAELTHNRYGIDVQLNMSNNDNLITNVMDFKPIKSRLSGCHNFYPQKNTAIPYDFFKEANQKYLQHRLSTAAFIGSHVGTQGPALGNKEFPTLEFMRFYDVVSQAKILMYCDEVDVIFFGNAYASEEELKLVSQIDRDEITFDFKTAHQVSPVEEKILFNHLHFRRMDITEAFIRYTMTRVYYKAEKILVGKQKASYNKGDVVIINDNDAHYKGECHIILQDNFKDDEKKYNFIGSIKPEELFLLNFIKANNRYQFKKN
ncbi:DUF871 domain-containing protein [Spiroplasma alleghenense]|uniref:Outer surface protein n=1 Tax=Spiroplasma alleghenense TaxID=216931 RepID=A0A345Z4I4_9MOLU|nr:MupG family TIM beta-alpha barrel fold protein [Spiroplasma alleghenense]AXK51513.1 hypothetical protein SALLE_v1c08430 [Spiroplasma alleghenense]